MKPLILTAILLLTGCSIQLKDERIDAAKLEAILQQQSAVITAIAEKVKELEKPKGSLDVKPQ